jgi:hypothetical protein
VDRRLRAIRISTVSLIWACGLAAGFFGLLGAAARYSCNAHESGFGCQTSGTIVGIVVLLAVIVVVASVTVLTYDRPARRVVTIGVVGFLVLVACFVVARVLVATA